MTSITQAPIDYRPLDEWRKYYGIDYQDMGHEVGVTSGAMSYYRTAGRPFPSGWIMTWQDRYKLATDDIGRLFFTRVGAKTCYD